MPLFDWQGLVRHFLTALSAARSPDQAASGDTHATRASSPPATPATPDSLQSETSSENPPVQEEWNHPTVHDLFAVGMKDEGQAKTLDGLLEAEHERGLRTRDQELRGFLAKSGCLTLCTALIVGSLVISVHIAKGIDLHHVRLSPTTHVALVSAGSAFLTGTIGWLIRRLRDRREPQARRRTGNLNDRTENDGRPSGGRRTDDPQQGNGS
ncbi:hypothetical protein [Streptomyces sp. NBC_00986]|uniref:hypothetical protein n=1 Tax=Streptomyces sp. NBC_00986 TaxID=2903702 RepID=UPI0038683B43|nr:hypothetical protein OG504_40190 [Streptomyces sp. NBC_00986]